MEPTKYPQHLHFPIGRSVRTREKQKPSSNKRKKKEPRKLFNISYLFDKTRRCLCRDMSHEEELDFVLNELPSDNTLRESFNKIYDWVMDINRLRGFYGGFYEPTHEGVKRDLTKEEWKYSTDLAIRAFSILHQEKGSITRTGKHNYNPQTVFIY
jgi:hypothetical protein